MQEVAYDALDIIYENCNAHTRRSLALTCKYIYMGYRHFMINSVLTLNGKTCLYSHQLLIIKWIIKHIDIYQTLLIKAYKSSGKTLIALESMLRLIKGTTDTAVICIAPNCAKAWQMEIMSHYPESQREVSNIVLCYHKVRHHYNFIMQDGNIKGKVIVITPSCKKIDTLIGRAKYLVFDEIHNLTGPFNEVNAVPTKAKRIFLTADQCHIKNIGATYELNSTGYKLPKITYEFITTTTAYNAIHSDLKSKDATHIALIDTKLSNIDGAKNAMGSRQIHDYARGDISVYDNYLKLGGILFSSINAISEGNNLNATSLMYIINPCKSTLQCIRRCIGCIHRESNENAAVKIVFVLPKLMDRTWARCKMATMSYEGFDIKADDRYTLAYDYLRRCKINISTLSEMEFLCAFGQFAGDIINYKGITLEHVRTPIIHCMLI